METNRQTFKDAQWLYKTLCFEVNTITELELICAFLYIMVMSVCCVWCSCTTKYSCHRKKNAAPSVFSANILPSTYEANGGRRADPLLSVPLCQPFTNDHYTSIFKVFGVCFLCYFIVNVLSFDNTLGVWVSVIMKCLPHLQFVFVNCFMTLLL